MQKKKNILQMVLPSRSGPTCSYGELVFCSISDSCLSDIKRYISQNLILSLCQLKSPTTAAASTAHGEGKTVQRG